MPQVAAPERFVGAAVCAQCHPRAAAAWQATPHAHAFETLERDGSARDPSCQRCHVTGFGRPTGFRAAVASPFLGVQCEECHGAGGRHSRLPSAATILRSPPPATCEACHTPEQSPAYWRDPDAYWLAGWHQVLPPALALADTAQIELFVMAHCPFGVEAVEAVRHLPEALIERTRLTVRFIVTDTAQPTPRQAAPEPPAGEACEGDASGSDPAFGFQSLHGPLEVEDDLRHLAVGMVYPEHQLAFIVARGRAQDEPWEEAARGLGLDPARIEAGLDDARHQLAADAARAAELGVSASPTVVVDGDRWVAGYDPSGVQRRLCARLQEPPQLCALLPECHADRDCQRGGFEGRCVEGDGRPHCEFKPAPPITLHVWNDPTCGLCNPVVQVRSLMETFAGLRVVGHDVGAGDWLTALGVEAVPAFALAGVEHSVHFPRLGGVLGRQVTDGAQTLYPLNRQRLGLGALYFARPAEPGRLDLFVEPTGGLSAGMLEAVDDALPTLPSGVRPRLHFLLDLVPAPDPDQVRIVHRPGGVRWLRESELPHFDESRIGGAALDAARRVACVSTLFPQASWDYVLTSARQPGLDWHDVARAAGADPQAIGLCAGSGQADSSLAAGAKLADTLHVQRPAILVNNRLRFDGLGRWNSDAFRRAVWKDRRAQR